MSYAGTLMVAAKGDREITMTRRFGAPRAMVFEAWTKPELLKRWMTGPSGMTMPICEVDLRVGGAYRYVWRTSQGQRWARAAPSSKSPPLNASSPPSASTRRGIRVRP